MLKVSVIIPTNNRAEFLRSAIESAVNQTFKDIEIIVADDKSKDHTLEVVKSFNDRRVKYILNNGNEGPSAARNTAILASAGEYLAFLDDDDEWLPDKLQKQVKLLDHSKPNICGVYSNRLFIEKTTGKIISDNPGTERLKGNLLNQLVIKSPIHTSTAVIRKRCLYEIGLFEETISYMEDWDLWVRLSMHWDFEYISEPLAKINIHGYSHLSQNLEGQTAAKEIILERCLHIFKRNKKSWSEIYINLGAQYCQLKKMNKGRKNIIKGIILYPFSKIAYFHLFSSLLGANNYQRMRNFYKSALTMRIPVDSG